MKLRCIAPFGVHAVGDEVDVPDGAAFDPDHYEAADTPSAAAVVTELAAGLPGQEGTGHAS